MKKKVLILGGSGILSLDVLKECLKRNCEVTCITRGTRDYRLPKTVKVLHGDVYHLDTVIRELEDKYDAILDFLSFEVVQLKHKLDYLGNKCNQYFFVSSAVAYSFEDEIITESTKLGNEYWDYGSNKVECEKFLKKNYNKYGVLYTIVRPYITYGKTRIPFGIIPESGEYWTLANRIIKGKPILMWDDGKAKCTLTNTEDFARAFVDLIGNPKAYNEAFHITSNEVLTWSEVLQILQKELGKTAIVFSRSTEEIIELLPEYSGVLLGDKARDRVFDNNKIMDAAPNFRNRKPFEIGISETIKNYRENPVERTMNYEWDGRIDWAIIRLAKKSGEDIECYKLKFVSSEDTVRIRDRYAYICGRYPTLGKVNIAIKRVIDFSYKTLKLAKTMWVKSAMKWMDNTYDKV